MSDNSSFPLVFKPLSTSLARHPSLQPTKFYRLQLPVCTNDYTTNSTHTMTAVIQQSNNQDTSAAYATKQHTQCTLNHSTARKWGDANSVITMYFLW